MKRLKIWVILGLLLILGLAIGLAFQYGEKSPVYAKGTIEIDPALNFDSTQFQSLFLIFHDASNRMPMPYGAMRLSVTAEDLARRKVSFNATKERIQVMNEGRPAPRFFRIKARLDRDGQGGPDQPGDLTGEVDMVESGSDQVNLKIQTIIQ
jgi:hypothetical protein